MTYQQPLGTTPRKRNQRYPAAYGYILVPKGLVDFDLSFLQDEEGIYNRRAGSKGSAVFRRIRK